MIANASLCDRNFASHMYSILQKKDYLSLSLCGPTHRRDLDYISISARASLRPILIVSQFVDFYAVHLWGSRAHQPVQWNDLRGS